MIRSKITLTLLLPFMLTACSTLMPTSVTNQPYLDAKKEITRLSPTQYQYLPDQSIYIGEIQNNETTGFGKIISPDGSIYQGHIKNGQADGFGKSTMITGEIYEGEHQAGRFEGSGKLTLSDQSFFIGYFKNHKVNRGEMHFPDGRIAELK